MEIFRNLKPREKRKRKRRSKMQKRASIGLLAIAVVIIVALAYTQVKAADYPLVPVTTVPRTCNLTFVTIVAGPDSNCQPNAQFPKHVICPDPVDCPGSDAWIPPLKGPYLLWEYLFKYIGVNPSHVLLSVASDIEIAQTVPAAAPSDPGAGDSTTKLGINMWESRILRYNANSTNYLARYYTVRGIEPRVATAGAIAGKNAAYCLLAGAGTTSLDPNQAIADEKSFQTPGCTIVYKVATNDKVIPGSMRIVDGQNNCTVVEDNAFTIDGKPVMFMGSAQFTTEGSCNYCWTNTDGGKSCVWCTACCVKKGTTRCVATSTLLDPATQCKDGTYTP